VISDWSASEFAALIGRSEEEVERWRAAGLLDPSGRGSFDERDLARLLEIRRFEADGYSPEQLAKAIRARELRPFLVEHLYPDRPQLSVEQAGARAGISPDAIKALRTALGLTGDMLDERDLQALEAFKVMSAVGLPWEAVLEGARVYGDTLRRLAETEVRLVHVHIHERLEASGVPDEEISRQIGALTDAVVPLLDGLVQWVHHQHLLQAEIEDAYLHLPSDAVREQGTVETTILFLDLASFTELTQTKGDRAAMHILARVEAAVRPVALDHDGKLVKQIGDGLMLAFRRPNGAAAFARAVVEASRHDPEIPQLHVGMHTGWAIYSAGDYIGKTVNTAARVTGASAAGEILMTEDVANQLDADEAAEPVGVRMLRGVESPVRLYRLVVRDEQRDPVCGDLVAAPPAARLSQDHEELWFCSQDCLRRFLLDEVG
jgi:adenylate cyclase